MAAHTLLYSTQCPNCTRFIDALARTSAAGSVRLVDVATLSPAQVARVSAVPALITPTGGTMYGTQAFEWLKQYEADIPLESFALGANGLGTGLAFSDVEATQSYAMHSETFSQFEPVD